MIQMHYDTQPSTEALFLADLSAFDPFLGREAAGISDERATIAEAMATARTLEPAREDWQIAIDDFHRGVDRIELLEEDFDWSQAVALHP